MSVLKASRTAQYALWAEFTWNYNDTAVDTVAGTSKTFGSTFGDNLVFDCIPLPPNATVVGGELVVETAYAGPTAATVSIGDSVSATRYGSTVDMKTAARTALTLTGFRGAGENIRITQNVTVANATAGKVTLRVAYVVQSRAQETQIA
jgi:hypothetical protein